MGERVLVIDDEKVVVDSIRRLLGGAIWRLIPR